MKDLRQQIYDAAKIKGDTGLTDDQLDKILAVIKQAQGDSE